jgi:hypothetical protein
MANVEINVRGLKDLIVTLDKMAEEVAAKNIVGSAYSANKVVEDSIKSNIDSNALVDTGLLRKSIRRKKLIYAKDGTVVILTGVNKNVRGVDKKGKARVPWRYANILENKFNFTKNGFEQSKDAVVDKFIKSLKAKVRKFIKSTTVTPK